MHPPVQWLSLVWVHYILNNYAKQNEFRHWKNFKYRYFGHCNLGSIARDVARLMSVILGISGSLKLATLHLAQKTLERMSRLLLYDSENEFACVLRIFLNLHLQLPNYIKIVCCHRQVNEEIATCLLVGYHPIIPSLRDAETHSLGLDVCVCVCVCVGLQR